MAQVIWTTTAASEIKDIGEYISGFSELYAKSLIRKIYKKVGLIVSFPQMGRPIPELGNPLKREIFEGNYRIMYEIIDEDIVLIQRIIHTSREFKKE